MYSTEQGSLNEGAQQDGAQQEEGAQQEDWDVYAMAQCVATEEVMAAWPEYFPPPPPSAERVGGDCDPEEATDEDMAKAWANEEGGDPGEDWAELEASTQPSSPTHDMP